jgi:hypothetical protein
MTCSIPRATRPSGPRSSSSGPALGAFVERSASGSGAHAFLRVSPNLVLKRNRYTRAHPSATPVGIEIYQRDRFAALTGIRIGDAHPRPNLNEPSDGDDLLLAFIAELDAHAAPILTPDLPPAPLSVPQPTQPILDLLPSLLTPNIRAAFNDPVQAYEEWQRRRAQSSSDSSLSAWRFALFYEASRASRPAPSRSTNSSTPKPSQSTPACPLAGVLRPPEEAAPQVR